MHRNLLICFSLFVTTVAFAAGKGGSIDAQIKDVDANGLKTTQVRIEAVDKKSKAVVAKPDAKGHVLVSGLEPGSYRVIAVLDGKAQSVQSVKVGATGSTSAVLRVNRTATAKAASSSSNKSMYRSGQVGSRFGGYWREDGKKKPKETGADNVQDGNAGMVEEAQRYSRSAAPPSGGGR